MNIFSYLLGTWKVKKTTNNKIIIKGVLNLNRTSKDYFSFEENVVSNFNLNLITGFKKFQIHETNYDIFFYLDNDKKNIYQNFKKRERCISYFYCKKDLYLMTLNIVSQNFFMIQTKIKGPKKKYNILAKYYRTI